MSDVLLLAFSHVKYITAHGVLVFGCVVWMKGIFHARMWFLCMFAENV